MHFAFALMLAVQADQASEWQEIKQTLETWYRIEQGTSKEAREHRGWAHERVRPVEGREWKFEYLYESAGTYQRITESDVTLVDVQEEVTALLDGAFDVLKLDAKLVQNQQKATLEVLAGATTRTADIRSFDGRTRTIRESGDTPVLYTVALALLRERQKGELRKAATRELLVIDPAYGFDDLRLRRDVKSEEYVRMPGDRRVSIVPVEFRPGGATDSAKPVVKVIIDRYGRIVETVGDTECFCRTMVATDKEARPEGAGVRPGRDDPMKSRMTPKGSEPAVEPKDPKTALKELQRRARQVIETRDLAVADDLYEREFYPAYVASRAPADAVAQHEMDALQFMAHKAVGGFEHELRYAAQLVEKVRAASDRSDEVEARAALAPLKALPSRVLGGKEPGPKLEALVREAQALVDTIAARRELRDMALKLTGTSTKQQAVQVPLKYVVCILNVRHEIDTTVRMVLKDEWAIINDDVYRVGDKVIGTDVKVDKITQWGCTVSYKGALRELGLPK